jgi:hypothetical protein
VDVIILEASVIEPAGWIMRDQTVISICQVSERAQYIRTAAPRKGGLEGKSKGKVETKSES